MARLVTVCVLLDKSFPRPAALRRALHGFSITEQISKIYLRGDKAINICKAAETLVTVCSAQKVTTPKRTGLRVVALVVT